jgi:thioredoxin reductase (NADPH)
MMLDTVIIGAGIAGLTAAIYGQRAGLNLVVLEAGVFGGQIINTPHIDNYPGLGAVSGAELIMAIHAQATGLGASIVNERANALVPKEDFHIVETGKQQLQTQTVIVATGASNRPLGLDREQHLVGRGVSYCATCDGMFFRDKRVAVVGGGNTAFEDALFLSKICSHVTLIHRRQGFRADPILVESLRKAANVDFLLDAAVTDLVGETRLESVRLQSTADGSASQLAVDALFIAVGQTPNNWDFAPPLALDAHGYAVAGEDCKTNLPGVFVAGDGRAKPLRQLVTAAADGAVAAMAAAAYCR